MKYVRNDQVNLPVGTEIHKFELAGLGKAPYAYVGASENALTFPDGTSKAGGCCDYCYTGIRYEFHFRSVDGKKFKVGSDCACKYGDAGMKHIVDAKVCEMNRQKRHVAEKVKLDELHRLLARDDVRSKLRETPHGNEKCAKDGATRFDQICWYMANAGTTGKLSWLKQIRALASGADPKTVFTKKQGI